MADSICFMISAVETLDFSQGAYDWFWNDCSLTKNPQSNEWHLLQTIPGYQYRNKKIEQDEQAAKKMFRNWLQRELDRRSGREQKQLKEAMGLQYNPKYENLLDLIPAEEITRVYPDALGEGARGTVYHATWHRPKRVGDLEAKNLEVALKKFKGDEESNLGRFIKELDATFAVVQGWGVRVVQLYGILRTPQHHDPGSPLSVLPTGTFFLVTEFCEKGSLLEYLKEVLKGDVTDWKIIISAVAELSTGLRELHKHNVVHKDLHARNVLVARRFYSADPGTGVYEPVILIADLGEGQILGSDISNPENHFEEDGKARDIRALGQLIWRMVQTQWEESDKNPNAESPAKHYLPQAVLLAILQCMREERDKQPTAEYIMDEFELLDREWDDNGYSESFLNLLEMDSEIMEYLFSAVREKENTEEVLKKFTTITD
ncbi:kinase-like domain-containing protein [Hyaloscypha finlandica]|nr:kinase-like domain-containing protein [Hyaloscypha finlandica]